MSAEVTDCRAFDIVDAQLHAWEPNKLSYQQSLDYIRETDEQSAAAKELVLGEALRGLFAWPGGTNHVPAKVARDEPR